MAVTVRAHRKLFADLPASANQAEFFYTTDTEQLWVGNGDGQPLKKIGDDPLVQGLFPVGTDASMVNPLLIAGVDDDNALINFSLSDTGALRVEVTNSAAGVATAANQTSEIAVLAAIAALLTAPLALPSGAATSSAQTTQAATLAAILAAISAATLPTGAATEITLAAVNTKLGSSLPLPTGAATEATLAAVNTKLGSSLPLPTGASTETTLAAVNTKLGASLPLPTGAATSAKQDTAQTTLASLALDASIGTDGATPPTITGTGVRGWLRGIYEKLTGTTGDSPDGTGSGMTVRPLNSKRVVLETTALLAGAATFTSQWYDSQPDGTQVVVMSWLASHAGASSACRIEQSERNDNTMVRASQGFYSGVPSAATFNRIIVPILHRYWRVVYVNGATLQTSFQLYTARFNNFPIIAERSTNDGSAIANITPPISAVGLTDFATSTGFYSTSNVCLEVTQRRYGGRFVGTADGTRQGWSAVRQATIFKQGTITTASGNTAIWTPATGNKFKLLKYRFVISGDATIATSGAKVTYKFQDGTTDMPIVFVVYVPSAAPSVIPGVLFDSGWVDFGTFGIMSSTAAQALNFNCGTALNAGSITVMVAGTEE